MKKILLISLLLACGCQPASVIPEPGPGQVDDPFGETISIAYLKTFYKGAPVRIDGEYIISGAVVSSDVQGNFYKTLVLDDGTGGIELRLDVEQIFKLFMIHSRVNVRCNGLWLGSYGGTLQLGAEPYETYQTQYLPETEVAEHCRPDTEFYKEVTPRKLSFGEIVPAYISTYVAFEGVQFAKDELGAAWADRAAETDTDRHLVDANGDTLTVRTSRHALFADKTLPDGSGYIEGVLTYFNGTYQLILSDDQQALLENNRF